MSALAPEVEAFIVDHIESVEQLEVLLLLYRHPSREWTGEAVAAELRTDPGSGARRLAGLAAQRMVQPRGPGSYAFDPLGPHARVVQRVAQAYKERRVTVIGLIFSKPPTPVRAFADAFRIGRKEEE